MCIFRHGTVYGNRINVVRVRRRVIVFIALEKLVNIYYRFCPGFVLFFTIQHCHVGFFGAEFDLLCPPNLVVVLHELLMAEQRAFRPARATGRLRTWFYHLRERYKNRKLIHNLDRPPKHTLPLISWATFPLNGKWGDYVLLINYFSFFRLKIIEFTFTYEVCIIV